MYRAGEINILSLVPDRTGVGGTKFGYHSFQKQPILDTRDTKNVHIWQDSWRSDRGAITAPSGAIYADTSAITPDGIECIALHGYARFSLSDPLAGPTTEMLGHTVQPSFGGHIWNYSAFVTGASNVVTFASATYPAVFANIGNRCFIARGDMEGVIYDASGATKKVYTIGVGAPTQAPVIAPSDVASYADIYLRKGSYYISNPDESGSLSTATAPGTDTLIVRGDGVTWDAAANKVNIVSKTTAFSTTGYLVSIANGSNIATFSTISPHPQRVEGFGLHPILPHQPRVGLIRDQLVKCRHQNSALGGLLYALQAGGGFGTPRPRPHQHMPSRLTKRFENRLLLLTPHPGAGVCGRVTEAVSGGAEGADRDTPGAAEGSWGEG